MVLAARVNADEVNSCNHIQHFMFCKHRGSEPELSASRVSAARHLRFWKLPKLPTGTIAQCFFTANRDRLVAMSDSCIKLLIVVMHAGTSCAWCTAQRTVCTVVFELNTAMRTTQHGIQRWNPALDVITFQTCNGCCERSYCADCCDRACYRKAPMAIAVALHTAAECARMPP